MQKAHISDQKRASEHEANIARWRAERDLERAVVSEITAIVEKVAAGDLDRRANLTRQTEHLAVIGRGVNGLLDHLSGMIRAVMEGAQKLSEQSHLQREAATQLADNSDAQQQAVSASMDQLRAITGEIDDTASNARKTLEAAQATALQANTGAGKIDVAVATMEDIKTQSQRIISVVDMIDEIAAKTNLLAINAAVEAARAGHHGAGFQIVAQEVRDLASATQDMAKQIAGQVGETQQAITAGVSVVGETTEALAAIQSSAGVTQANMEHIHRACELQASQARELLAAIEQIAALGKQNQEVALATAESAKTLSVETQRLATSATRYADDAADRTAAAADAA